MLWLSKTPLRKNYFRDEEEEGRKTNSKNYLTFNPWAPKKFFGARIILGLETDVGKIVLVV